jgi:uncharacterized protein
VIGALHLGSLIACVLLLSLATCSSPNPVLYTIAPVRGAEQAMAPKVILLQQIAMERYLERSQIVHSSENYKLDVMANDWWGEPLSAMLSRILVEELQQRLPNSVVISEVGAVSAAPDATITLNVQRMDEDASGNLVLLAQAGIMFRGRSAPLLHNYRFSVAPSTPNVSGEVAAISTGVGELADGLAALLVTRPSR